VLVCVHVFIQVGTSHLLYYSTEKEGKPTYPEGCFIKEFGGGLCGLCPGAIRSQSVISLLLSQW